MTTQKSIRLWPWMLFCALLAGAQKQFPSRTDVLFEEVPTDRVGLHWFHENGRSERRYLPETMGGGAAFLDYDQDGWLDLYFINSGACDFYQPAKPLRNALFRNRGDGTFLEVTTKAGVQGGQFGMGVAAGDFDNDRYPDLFLTAYGESSLYHNKRDGTFTDISERAGLRVSGWTTSAVWFDYDRDGWLDLFVCSYVQFSADQHILCGMNPLGKSFYCVPRFFEGTPSLLFRNNGNGTFTEIGHSTAIGQSRGKALGVVATDVNNDGWTDLYVANDTVQDFLFLNRQGKQWDEVGLFMGVALSAEGKAQAGMGVDAADFDFDGWQDLVVTNIDHEYAMLFRNSRDQGFLDVTTDGLAEPTFLLSGFGVKFFDFDLDGDEDLLMANGHPDDMVDAYGGPVRYLEPLLLFENAHGRFRDISRYAGPVFRKGLAGRGLAVGDYDNDGRPDAVVTTNGGSPLVLRNRSGREHHWVGLTLENLFGNRDGIGVKITWSAAGKTGTRLINSGGSYLSSHDRRQVIGLGKATRVDWLEIQWPPPEGQSERITDLPVDRYLRIRQGRGIQPP